MIIIILRNFHVDFLWYKYVVNKALQGAPLIKTVIILIIPTQGKKCIIFSFLQKRERTLPRRIINSLRESRKKFLWIFLYLSLKKLLSGSQQHYTRNSDKSTTTYPSEIIPYVLYIIRYTW